MPIPRVAIIGRPNAGKSSLMNMIAGAKVSIVDPTPGVTRDRVTAIVDLDPPDGRGKRKTAEFVDTGGFGVYVAEGARYDEIGNDLARLTDSIEFQIGQAVEGADLVLFAVDAQQGVTAADRDIARLLRQRGLGSRATARHAGWDASGRADRGRPLEVRVIATKVDGPRWEAHAADAANLGFGEPIAVSAKTNYFRRDFLEEVWRLLPEPTRDEPAGPRADMMVAIIGKRNAGKSTLVNTLAGEPRMIVSEIPGTTRDAVDVRFEVEGRTFVAIDTAGLRRKRSFQNMIEHFAFDRVQRAIDRADVVLLLVDATEKISQVDEQLAALAQKSYKPTILVINKWDLAEGKPGRTGAPVGVPEYERYVRTELKAVAMAPIAFISGKSGRNVRATIDLAFELKQQSAERVTTGKLNRLFRSIVERQGPTDTKGTQAKVYYVAQTGVEPPTITLVVNHPELFRPNYLRFLMNRLREESPFKEVPVRLVVRARRTREDDLPTLALDEDAPQGLSRGRKGVTQRLTGPRLHATSEPTQEQIDAVGDRWLDEEFSTATGVHHLSDDARSYFRDDAGDDDDDNTADNDTDADNDHDGDADLHDDEDSGEDDSGDEELSEHQAADDDTEADTDTDTEADADADSDDTDTDTDADGPDVDDSNDSDDSDDDTDASDEAAAHAPASEPTGRSRGSGAGRQTKGPRRPVAKPTTKSGLRKSGPKGSGPKKSGSNKSGSKKLGSKKLGSKKLGPKKFGPKKSGPQKSGEGKPGPTARSPKSGPTTKTRTKDSPSGSSASRRSSKGPKPSAGQRKPSRGSVSRGPASRKSAPGRGSKPRGPKGG